MIDLGSLRRGGHSDPDGVAALGEVRRGIESLGADEGQALVWLYIGLTVCARYPETAIAMLSSLHQFVGNVEQMQAAAAGIAQAAGDRSAG
jgi:hypothetical protein